MPSARIHFSICTSDSFRLDQILGMLFPQASVGQIRRALSEKQVLLNGRAVRASQRVRCRDQVEVFSDLRPVFARAELARKIEGSLGRISILYQDQYLLVVEKPRGMPSITLRHEDELTLADCLAALSREAQGASADPREAGLVQRLDYWTGGLALAAKSPEMWKRLHQAFTKGRVEKTYLALVEGRPESDSFVLDSDLMLQGKKVRTAGISRKAGASAAETAAEVLWSRSSRDFGDLSLMRLHLRHTHRHQIRVHLAASGHPLVGDDDYGSKLTLARTLEEILGEARLKGGFYLHAESLTIKHPASGKEMFFRSTPPIV